jgi:hypothetical protein
MKGSASSETQAPDAAPLRGVAEPDEGPRSAWASEETVPLRIAAERVEVEERADRLALVIGAVEGAVASRSEAGDQLELAAWRVAPPRD